MSKVGKMETIPLACPTYCRFNLITMNRFIASYRCFLDEILKIQDEVRHFDWQVF